MFVKRFSFTKKASFNSLFDLSSACSQALPVTLTNSFHSGNFGELNEETLALFTNLSQVQDENKGFFL